MRTTVVADTPLPRSSNSAAKAGGPDRSVGAPVPLRGPVVPTGCLHRAAEGLTAACGGPCRCAAAGALRARAGRAACRSPPPGIPVHSSRSCGSSWRSRSHDNGRTTRSPGGRTSCVPGHVSRQAIVADAESQEVHRPAPDRAATLARSLGRGLPGAEVVCAGTGQFSRRAPSPARRSRSRSRLPLAPVTATSADHEGRRRAPPAASPAPMAPASGRGERRRQGEPPVRPPPEDQTARSVLAASRCWCARALRTPHSCRGSLAKAASRRRPPTSSAWTRSFVDG